MLNVEVLGSKVEGEASCGNGHRKSALHLVLHGITIIYVKAIDNEFMYTFIL